MMKRILTFLSLLVFITAGISARQENPGTREAAFYKETAVDSDTTKSNIPKRSRENRRTRQAVSKKPGRAVKDYSRYQNIYELIRSEIPSVNVEGRNVYTRMGQSFSLTAQVLYEVDGMIVNDISFVLPVEVERIEYINDSGATAYGMRGANGIIKIGLKKR